MNGNDGAPTTAQGVLREPPPLLVEVFPERLDSALSSLEQALRRQIQIGDERPPVQLGSPIFDGHTSSDDDELVEDEDGQDVEQQEAAAGNALDFLTNDVSTRIELHQVARVAEQSIPFVLLLLLVFVYTHRSGIASFIWLSCVLFNMNQIMKHQVSLKQARQIPALLGVTASLIFHIGLTYYLFREEQLWRSLFFFPPLSPSFWNVVWVIVMNDLMVRYGSMLCKGIIMMLIGHKPPFKRKAQLFSLIESISDFYRTLLPIPLWFVFFVGDDGDRERIFSSLVAGLYLVFKINGVLLRLRVLLDTARAYLRHELRFGKHASQEQIVEAGDTCAVCQDKMKDAVILHCGHLFCEDCISRWFEREKTCPLCRASIQSAGVSTYSDGATPMCVNLF